MRKLLIVMLLLSFSVMSAQKVKMKDGTVYVDKEAFLKYKGDVFYTFDGVRLFSVTREKAEVSSKFTNADRISDQATSRRGNTVNRPLTSATTSSTPKVVYTLVKFSMFDLEFETSLNKKKIIKSFYNKGLVTKKGLIDESKAWNYAKKAHKNISGTRESLN